MSKYCLVLISERDYDFFTTVAVELLKLGNEVILLSYHTPHKKRYNSKNLNIIFFQDFVNSTSFDELERSVENNWILHEQVTYDVDAEKLSNKFSKYEKVAKIFLQNYKFDYVIQELGGFVAPLSLFKACMTTDTSHLFIEPTFLNGHIGFIKDDLSYKISSNCAQKSEFDAQAFVNQVRFNKSRVVPKKDRHHFTEATIRKFLNTKNLKNLYMKFYYRYILRFEFEYKYTGIFIKRAINAIINKKYLSKNYKDIAFLQTQAEERDCFFFPFHVKLDFSLTVRSPQNLDQLRVVNEICDLIGDDNILVVKEHPASSGAYGSNDLKRLKYPDNVVWLNSGEKTFDIIQHCKSVFTINSKAGVEALIMGVPVFCAGESYYRGEGLAVGIEDYCLDRLAGVTPKKDKLLTFLKNLEYRSFPCELYQNDAENIHRFCQAIEIVTKEKRYLNA